jgi:hypothetical protein
MELPAKGLPLLEHDFELLPVAAPELGNRHRLGEAGNHVCGVRVQERRFGARDAIPRQPADRIEQRRAEAVVEIFRRQLTRCPLQMVGDFGRKAIAVRRGGVQIALAQRKVA